LAGAAVACIHHTGAPSRKRGQMALLISGGVFGALLLMTHMDYSNRLVASFGYTIIAIASACLVSYLVAANRGDRLNEFFSHRSLVFFGRYSYAMYVVHLPIATLFNSWIQILKLGTSPVAVIVIGMIAPFVCTVLLSMLSWHLLEKRILNWRGRFS
jgi:peptidoglycan/LPS O-acetylase OafA/YrhL